MDIAVSRGCSGKYWGGAAAHRGFFTFMHKIPSAWTVSKMQIHQQDYWHHLIFSAVLGLQSSVSK